MLSTEIIKNQLKNTLYETNFTQIGKLYRGKVRDNYSFNGKRLIITTDRISAFDRVLGTIPFKGQVLNQIAAFWFEKTKDIIANHMIEIPDPNVIVAKECKALPVEMVIRGYITGVTTTSAWYNYERGVRNFCGNILPEGLKKNQKLEKPISTPSTKAEHRGHDISLSKEEIIKKGIISEELFNQMEKASFALYQRGVEICAKQGIILVDTKYEFGLYNGKLMLMDEIHTPDSSRFWFADEYNERFEKGKEQKKIDKEYVREWFVAQGFRGEGTQPELTPEVRAEAARRYTEAYELITGQKFKAEPGNVIKRIEMNLREKGFFA
jgi:phosphoribosylaminoimidazole-succinocarboxamide synthase